MVGSWSKKSPQNFLLLTILPSKVDSFIVMVRLLVMTGVGRESLGADLAAISARLLSLVVMFFFIVLNSFKERLQV